MYYVACFKAIASWDWMEEDETAISRQRRVELQEKFRWERPDVVVVAATGKWVDLAAHLHGRHNAY
jgi:hypothetical protein